MEKLLFQSTLTYILEYNNVYKGKTAFSNHFMLKNWFGEAV